MKEVQWIDPDFLAPKDAWDRLSMKEKAAMMKVAVQNGITNLSDIRAKYNEFAEGGNLYKGGGSIVSDRLVDMTIKEEGFNKQPEDIGDGKMTLGSGLTASKWHDLYRKRGNKWSAADNRMAVRQELSDRERWAKSNIPNWKGLPDSSKEALLMYKYNYDFNRINSPKLFAALEAGNLPEAARQMDATSKDPKFRKGLANRRKREQAHFMLGVRPTPIAPNDITLQNPDNTFVYNPYLLQQQNTTMLPQVVPDESAYVSTHEVSPEEIKAQKLQESFDNINRFNRTMEMLGNNLRIPTFHPTIGNDVLDLLWATRGNDSPLLQMADEYARGGKIHIKEKNRGKFTRLKERTGKSASWFKAHGTPAQKKMAIFALNSKKWKHGLGGNLFDGTSQPTQQMNIGLNATNGWQPYTLGDIVANGERVAQQRKALQDTFLNFPVESNDATAVTNGRPQNTHLEGKAVRGGTANAAWEREHPGLAQLGYAASAVPFAVASAPILGAAAETGAGQAVTAGLGWLGDAAVSSPLFTNAASRALGTSTLLPWLDAGMTAGFGAHGIQETAEGNFTPMTAFEIAPLGRLAKPIAKEAALAVENYRYPLGRPQVSEDFLTVKPQVRTRVGDVEIDNPNLLYHLDRGDRTGAFSNQGAYVEDGVLFPGTPKEDTAIPYSWWNKGKPYAVSVGGQPMTRLMTTTEDTPGMLHVRSQNYPIGQWNGRRGVVTNAEYVDPEGVDVSGSTYTLDPDYGWRRVFAEETPAAEWAMGRTAPEITAENTVLSSGINSGGFKGDFTSTGNIFEDYIKNAKIKAFLDGKPYYELDLGPFGKKVESFPSDWSTTRMPFSDASIEVMNNTSKPRILAQAEKDIRDLYDPTIDGPDIEKYVKEQLSYVEKQLDDKIKEGYDLGSEALFKYYDKGKTSTKTGGLQFTEDGRIVLRGGEDPEQFAVHEWEHRRTNSNVGGEYYGDEKKLLRKALTKEFRELSETVPDFKGMNMEDEMVTTISDTREALIGKVHLRKTKPELQNKMIEKSSDDAIFKAVEKSNAYGYYYIQRMRELGKLTPELAQHIREALKYVGAVVTPVGLTGMGISNNQETLGEEQ